MTCGQSIFFRPDVHSYDRAVKRYIKNVKGRTGLKYEFVDNNK